MTKEQVIKELRICECYSVLPSIEALDMAVKALEQKPCDDCISRADVKQFVSYIQSIKDSHNEKDTPINYGTICDLVIRGWKLMELPPVTLAHCIATIKFSKEDLKDICNERIEIECTHGTCKDCKLYKPDQHKNMRCQVLDFYPNPDFYCADFEKRGNENEIN